MDPLSHAAFGRTLAALDRRRAGGGATVACVLGALCPDLDILRTLQGWDVYLLHHQAGTHSLLGVFGCGLLTGSVVRLFARRVRWLLLVLAATIGAASHVLLDVLSGADVEVFAPVWNHAFPVPLFAMADPWLLGTLVLSAVVCSLATAEGAPDRSRRALAAIAAVVVLKAALYARSIAIEHRAASRGSSTHVEAVFGSWTRWTYNETHAGTIERWDIDVRTGTAARAGTVERGLDAPLAVRSRELPTVENLLASHDDTFARIEVLPDGRREVRWSALRYCVIEKTSEPVCGLWFGGEYDARGRVVAAFVRIGSLVQRRGRGRTAAHDE